MMNKIPKGWEKYYLSDCFNAISIKNKIKTKDYLPQGKFPIIDQGQDFISGYSNDENLLIKVKKPIIIFGDHTRCFKFINFDFIAGADGIKILEPKDNFNEKLFYYFCQILDFPNKGYSRHFQYLKKAIINFPKNLSEQKAIVDKLDDSFAKIENAITNLINAKENLKLYKQSVLKSAFNGDLLPNTSPTQRKKVKFEDVLKYEQPTKYIVKSTKYNNDFKTPVLTAGKGFILGYTNETEGIFTNTPVIIFDDFTTSSQYVNFHFKVKSSAMKILRPVDNVNLKFLFYKMQTIQHKSDTHKRYWISEYAKLEIPLPTLSEQNLIVAEIDRRFAIVDKTLNLIDKSIQNAKNLKQSILKKAFSGELRSDI